jgi:hypothetical protein
VSYSDPFGLSPDLIFDLFAIGADLFDIARHGLSEGRGSAFVTDVALALVPGAPAIAGFGRRAARSAGIQLTARGVAHVEARHMVRGAETAGRSVFNEGEDVLGLILNASGQAAREQAGGNFVRIMDAGRNIGVDRATDEATSIYTVITNNADELITAFPGRPGGMQ